MSEAIWDSKARILSQCVHFPQWAAKGEQSTVCWLDFPHLCSKLYVLCAIDIIESLEWQTCLMYILIKFMAIKIFGGKDNKVMYVYMCVYLLMHT